MNKRHYIGKILRLKKNIKFLYRERERIESLKCFEKRHISNGFYYIAGIDEVGRGALAGPVVAAAVVIKDIDYFYLTYLKDSKRLNRVKREDISEFIKYKSRDIGIGIVEPDIIDKINIVQATFLAMKRALMNLKRFPDYILVDAFKIPYIRIPQDNLIKGEDKSISIAAASIIAKVCRDKIMYDFNKKYPFYQFDKNLGYGTRNHIMAIKKYGICPLHRKTFKNVSRDMDINKNVIKQERLYAY
ncbi:MAG: ribonuclease HII [Atribacterota bacterium]